MLLREESGAGNIMTIEDKYKERYKTKDTPWDIGKPDFNLIEVVAQFPIQKCKALDIGCGTGDNSIWLAQSGFSVSATDTSKEALIIAKEKASKAKVICDFININFFQQKVDKGAFGFVFDRGCFHSFSSDQERSIFARNIAEHLEASGMWLSIIGNLDEQRNVPGPPQRSAKDIVLAVEPYFEILSLTTSYFGSNHPKPPRAWRCLLRKRN